MRTSTVFSVAGRSFLIKFLAVAASLTLFAGLAFAQPGLAERRAMAAYREAPFPELVKNVQTAAGFAVPIEVQWDSLMKEGHADNYREPWYLTDIFFTPLVDALKKVAIDDMGKKALQDGLKRIVIRYDAATAPASNYAEGLTFADGVLTLNFEPGTNADQITARAEAIQKLLESKL